jgi:hypothetical protein
MKKLLVLLFALVLVVVLQPAQDAQATEDGSVVAICHFPGHDVDKLITGRGLGCLNNGGNPIVVGIKACEKGHGVAGCDGIKAQSSCEFCEAGGGSDSPASHEH